jgi:hypothetical protein
VGEHFTSMGSFTTVQVVSPSQVIDVLRVTFRTTPSGVVAFASVPYKGLVGIVPGDVGAIEDRFIEPLAFGIERMMGSGKVASATGSEDVDASGLLVDYIDAVVSYQPATAGQPGPFEQVIRIPVHAFDEPSFYGPLIQARIDAAYQAMVDLANA